MAHLNRLALISFLITCPTALRANIFSFAVVTAGGNFDFDTGTNAASGGDISFTGSGFSFVGAARGGPVLNIGGVSDFLYEVTNNVNTIASTFAEYATNPVTTSSMTVGEWFAVKTNGGNVVGLVIDSINSSSITFYFITYNSSIASPVITGIMNASSLIPLGLPNYGISPSCLFVIRGTNLSDPNAPVVNQDSTMGLPTTLNGTSISVTINGTTVYPAMYHALATEVAAVLPAATPIGSGTITITYNDVSSTAPFQVVPSAYGFDQYDGSAVATDAITGALISYANPATPGEILIFWGTGLGADPADSDTTYAANGGHPISTPLSMYVGGVQVPALDLVFSGQSVYPGVHVLGVTIPQGVPNGCFVPIVVVTGSGSGQVTSSTPTLPITSDGQPCSDPLFAVTASSAAAVDLANTLPYGALQVGALQNGSATNDVAAASFALYESNSAYTTFATYAAYNHLVSPGGCIVADGGPTGAPGYLTLLAGSVNVQGPQGSYPMTLATDDSYSVQMPAGAIPANGGQFVFSGTGALTAPDVNLGPFSATVTVPSPPLVWANQSAAATINRGQGFAVSWSGGQAGTYVLITGTAETEVIGTSDEYEVNGAFYCYAPQSALSFTIPAYITSAMLPGTASVTVENVTNYSPFSAPGLNIGFGYGFTGASVNSTWQ